MSPGTLVCIIAAAVALAGCGSGDSSSSAGGSGGITMDGSAGAVSGGSAGTIGSGGSAAGGASGGVAGAGASGGSGGSGGSAGSGGAGASGGSGGGAGASGTGGTSGAAGAAGAAGMAGAAGAVNACNDWGPEPNNSEALASPACGSPPCEVTDCDSTGSVGFGGPLASADGVIGPGDIDWFSYHGTDTIGLCLVDVAATTSDSGFRLCAFPACDLSATQNVACASGTLSTSPLGLKGCCTTAPGTVAVQHDCAASATDNDTAKVYLRVDQANACTSYSVDYRF